MLISALSSDLYSAGLFVRVFVGSPHGESSPPPRMLAVQEWWGLLFGGERGGSASRRICRLPDRVQTRSRGVQPLGMPSPRFDPKGHAASQRQVSAWGHKTLSCMSRAGLSTTGTRQTPRRRASMYISPSTSLPRRCPVSSTSALFVPTTRTFIRRWRLSVISQQTESGSSYVDGRDAVRSPRIVIAGGRTVPTRLLDFSEYTQIRDATDYTQPARRKPRPPKPPGH